MEKQTKSETMMRGNMPVGVLLIFLGIAFLVGQLFDIHLGSYL